MRKCCYSTSLLFCMVIAICFFAGKDALAQDPVKVGPKIYKVLLENERIRVCEARFHVGDSIPMHSHPDHSVYVQSGGTLEVTGSDGKSQPLELKAGEVLWLPAQAHKGKNIGKSEVVLIVSELKEPAPKPAATPQKQ